MRCRKLVVETCKLLQRVQVGDHDLAPAASQNALRFPGGHDAGHGVQGIAAHVGDVWQVDFSPPPGALSAGSSLEAADWPAPSQLLDLTGLEPPEPMTRVLAALEAAQPGEVVFALLDREPLFLLPQLKARGHAWVGNHAADASGYRLLVRRGADA